MLNTLNLHNYDSIPPGHAQVPNPLSTAALHDPPEFHPNQAHTMPSCFLCIDTFYFLALYNLRSLSLVPNIGYVLLPTGQCPALVNGHFYFRSLLMMVFSPFLLIFFIKQSAKLQVLVTSPSRRLSDAPLPFPLTI